MNIQLFKAVGVVLAILLLSACGGKAPAARNVRQEQAIEFNQRAQRAFLRGEYQVAIGLYENALLIDATIENEDGIAINLLNLAKVNQAQGRFAVAQEYLERILAEKALHYPVAQLAAAATQYGLIRLREGDIAAAKTWADKAAEFCAPDCETLGAIANLRANIAVHSKEKEQALLWCERSRSINEGGELVEFANALRLLAQARLLRQEFGLALPLLEEALAIDKGLGLPEKIRADLLLVAQAQEGIGRSELAAQYRERAARVAAASLR